MSKMYTDDADLHALADEIDHEWSLLQGDNVRLYEKRIDRVREASIDASLAPVVVVPRRRTFQAAVAEQSHGVIPIISARRGPIVYDEDDRQSPGVVPKTRTPFHEQVQEAYARIARAIRMFQRRSMDRFELANQLDQAIKPIALMVSAIDLKEAQLPGALAEVSEAYLRDRHDATKAKAFLTAYVAAREQGHHEDGHLCQMTVDYPMIAAMVRMIERLDKNRTPSANRPQNQPLQ
jgi:hypothetical protein